MNLVKRLSDEQFVSFVQLTFSEAADKEEFMEEADSLSRFVDAIVVSDYSFGLPTMNPIVPSLWLTERNIEPVMEFYIEHRNPKAIFSDVLAGIGSNLTNVIISSYENPKDYGTILELVDGIKLTLEKQSKAKAGEPHRLSNIGLSSGYMIERPEDSVVLARRYGADFLCPPETYDISAIIEPMVKRARAIGVHTILRTTLFTSVKTVKFAHKFIPEMYLPPEFINALESSSNPLEIGIGFVRNFVDTAKSIGACGIYLVVPQRFELYKYLPTILRERIPEMEKGAT